MGTLRRIPKLTFSHRFIRTALYWGVPMVCLEFVGVPRHAWGTVLVIVVPATFVGVLASSALEHWFVTYKNRSSNSG
jgi:hypothetical protein